MANLKEMATSTAITLASLGAQATEPPKAPDVCADNQARVEKIYDEDKDGNKTYLGSVVQNCGQSEPGKPYIHKSEPVLDSTDDSVGIKDTSMATISVAGGSEDMLVLGATVRTGDMLVKLSAETQKDMKAYLIGAGIPVGNTGYVLLSATQYEQILRDYKKTPTSQGVAIEGGVMNPIPGVQSFVVQIAHAKTGDKLLDEKVNEYSYTVQDVLRVIEQNSKETRIKTTRDTTRTDVTKTTRTMLNAGNMTAITLGTNAKFGSNTLGHVSVTHRDATHSGSKTTSQLGVTHYMPEYRANVSTGVSSTGVVAFGVQKQIAKDTNLFATVAGKDGKYTGHLGIHHTFGSNTINGNATNGNATNPGEVPDTAQTTLRTRIEGLTPSNSGAAVRPTILGETISKETAVKKVTTTSDSSTVVVTKDPEPVVKPKPPVTPEPGDPEDPETPDTTPPVITLNGSKVVHSFVGETWIDPGATCQDDRDTTCVVNVSGSIPPDKYGEFYINYSSKDKSGNEAVESRTVIKVCPTGTTPADGGICYED